MSQNFCQHENQKLLPLAKEFWVSYIIKNDHSNPNYNPYLHRFFCSKLQSYHIIGKSYIPTFSLSLLNKKHQCIIPKLHFLPIQPQFIVFVSKIRIASTSYFPISLFYITHTQKSLIQIICIHNTFFFWIYSQLVLIKWISKKNP